MVIMRDANTGYYIRSNNKEQLLLKHEIAIMREKMLTTTTYATIKSSYSISMRWSSWETEMLATTSDSTIRSSYSKSMIL